MCKVLFKEKDFVLTANVEIPGEGMKIAGKEYKALPEKYCVGLCKNLWEKRDTGDFALIFSGLEVPCHKNVLSAASPVFAAMVENEHLEAIENKANIEVSPEVGQAFIRFLYTGELEEGILKEEATVFLELGEKFDVQGLKDLAEDQMVKLLDRKNMVEFLSIGDMYNAGRILEAALRMTKSNITWLRSQVFHRSLYLNIMQMS